MRTIIVGAAITAVAATNVLVLGPDTTLDIVKISLIAGLSIAAVGAAVWFTLLIGGHIDNPKPKH